MTSYTATAVNEYDTITATPTDEDATVVIASTDATIAENVATWAQGTNVVTITVTAIGAEEVYTVTVSYGGGK